MISCDLVPLFTMNTFAHICTIGLLALALVSCGKETVETKAETPNPQRSLLPTPTARPETASVESVPLAKSDQSGDVEEEEVSVSKEPLTLDDADGVVGEVLDMVDDDEFDPALARLKLRRMASAMAMQSPGMDGAERESFKTVSHHLNSIARSIGNTAESSREAFNALRSLRQMYLQ